MMPSVGRIVHFKLDSSRVEQINRRRQDAQAHMPEHRGNANGVMVHVGNQAVEGDVVPLVIVRVWGDTPESAVNGQLLLDGSDSLWVTSVTQGDALGQWSEPPRV